VRRTAVITALAYLSLCPLAQAQVPFVSDARALTVWSTKSIADVSAETKFYGGVLGYRGPGLLNVWAVGAMDWPLANHYTGTPPGAVTAGFDVVDLRGWTIGFAASGTRAHAALTNNGNALVSGVAGTLYASYDRGVGNGEVILTAQATIDDLNTDFKRNQLIGAALLPNQANVDSLAWLPSASVAYQFTEVYFFHGPELGIQSVVTTVDAFNEAGNAASRRFTDQSAVNTTGYFGYFAKFDFLNLQPFAEIKASYRLSISGSTVQSQSTGGGPIASFTSVDVLTPFWTFSSEIGTRVFVTAALTAFVAWSEDYNHHLGPTEHQALVGASYAF